MSPSDSPGADRSTHEVVRDLGGAGILSKKLLGLSYSGLQSRGLLSRDLHTGIVNPAVEPGVFMMHFFPHVAEVLEIIDSTNPHTKIGAGTFKIKSYH